MAIGNEPCIGEAKGVVAGMVFKFIVEVLEQWANRLGRLPPMPPIAAFASTLRVAAFDLPCPQRLRLTVDGSTTLQ